MAQFRGIAFPFKKDKQSFPAAATDEELIRMSILQIMSTTRGERVMRPSFGANVYRYVFANNTDFLASLIASETRSAILQFEPRVTIQNVTTERSDNEITTTIDYIIKSTGRKQTVEVTEKAPV